ncbi:MAG: hypothetical protein IT581_23685 [Verrucomicrobiales bacterium]|nr:hypothetical protein [Verrucomicrobiales bacterium]
MAASVTSERSTNSVALRVMVRGNLAYLADTDAFRIYDVTNRAEPRLLRSETLLPSSDLCIDKYGFLEIAQTGEEYRGSVFFRPEIAPIPKHEDFGWYGYFHGDHVEKLRLWNGKTLVAADHLGQVTAYPDGDYDGVRLLENLPEVPMVLPENPVPKVAAFGRRTELMLIDAPVDPMWMWFTYPRMLGSVELEANVVAIAQQDPIIAWVACREDELLAVQTYPPTAPRILSRTRTTGSALGITLRDGLVYVSEGELGVEVFDVTDPKAPKRIGQIDTPGEAHSVEVNEGDVFVADGTAGLTVRPGLERRERQQIQFVAPPAVLGVDAEPVAVRATSNQGLPVSLTVLDGPGRFDEGRLDMLGFGNVWIRAASEGDDVYAPAVAFHRVASDEPSDPVAKWIAFEYPNVPDAFRGRLDDADGDGASNESEWFFGTNPMVHSLAHGRIKILQVFKDGDRQWLDISLTSLKLMPSSGLGNLQYKTNLAGGDWLTIQPEWLVPASTGAAIKFPMFPSSSLIFRAAAPPSSLPSAGQ